MRYLAFFARLIDISFTLAKHAKSRKVLGGHFFSLRILAFFARSFKLFSREVIGSGATPTSKPITLENELKIQVLLEL